MTPEERNVIGGIFDRLREAAYQPRDPEAERFIQDRIREQPYAPYAMAQSMYVLEQAVANLGQQNEQLQQEVAQLRQYAQQVQSQPAQSGGFLSGIFGGGGASRPAAPPPPRAAFSPQPRTSVPQQGYAQSQPQGGSPWGGQPQQGGYAPQQAAAPQRGGMGFLGTAATAAVGVAGGLIAGNMLMNALNNNGGMSGVANSLGFGGDKGSDSASMGGGNDSYASSGSGYEDAGQAGQGAYDNASYEDTGGGADSGGDTGGDWA